MTAPIPPRIRIRFTKLGKIRFTSHRDVARIWERALRRIELPVARSQGFSPRPRLHFGLALSTGYESLAEYIDVDVVDGTVIDETALPAAITPALPRGLAATVAAVIPHGTLSLQHAVTSSRWELEVHDLDISSMSERVEGLLAAPELMMTRQRKGKDVTDDVRPHLLHLEVLPGERAPTLVAELGTRDRGLRPSELLTLLGQDALSGLVRRTHQFIEHEGVKTELLPAPSEAPAPHAEARAS